MNKLRIIIADDERPARLFLKNILTHFDNVEIVGEAENGFEALEIIKQMKPDLALLDLQMPEMSGIEVVRNLPKNQLPLIAFVTAFDEYAVQAFETNAIDYLLKPIEEKRLFETLQRASERLEQKDYQEKAAERLKTAFNTHEKVLGSNQTYLERIPIKHKGEIFFLMVDEIVSVVADGELLHFTSQNNKKFVINYRLKDLEAKLKPELFVRLSRSALVRFDLIQKVIPQTGGNYEVLLKNGQHFNVSRSRSKIFRESFLKL